MYLKFAAGVIVPKSAIIAVAMLNAANESGIVAPAATLWVTSGNDRVHMRGSKHYEDAALDFRSKALSTVNKHKLLQAVRARLGSDYQAILEDEGGANEHFHIEFDEKK